jgi:hypothetical protein
MQGVTVTGNQASSSSRNEPSEKREALRRTGGRGM